jgi:hypothetical protein
MSKAGYTSDRWESHWNSLEETIRAAGTYVVPSDNLRPRTLEAARELSSDRKSMRRFWRLVIALCLGCVLSIPLAERLHAWHERSRSPSARELQWQALQLAESDSQVGANWGMFEAFRQLRSMQAERLGRSTTGASSVQF